MKQWIYDSGFQVGEGDVVDFKTGYCELNDDTIFIQGQPKGKVLRTFKLLNEMKIISIGGNNKVGIYLDLNR